MSRGLPGLAQRQEARRDAADPRRARRRTSRWSASTTSRRTTSRSRTEPTFEGNALLKARAGVRGDRAADARRRQRPVRRRAQRHAGRAVGPLVAAPPKGDDAQQRAAARPARRRAGRAARRPLRVRGRPRATRTARELVVHGRMDGRIIRELRGSGGFGYDVLFVADEHAGVDGLTSAELDPAEKDRISHRGRALRALAPRVARLPGLSRLRRTSRVASRRADPAADEHAPERGEDEHEERVDGRRDRDLDAVEDLDRDEDRQRARCGRRSPSTTRSPAPR